MIINHIVSNPTEKRQAPEGVILNISEMFSDTIQGEGINAGVPATFIRLKDCTLDCKWCDTLEVWRYGNPYCVSEVVDMLNMSGVVHRMKTGQHLILTGGSPLLQQESLVALIRELMSRFKLKPYIEVENEATRMPSAEFEQFVDCWNNSPKLANSGMKERVRYKPDIIKHMSSKRNSWFKFVVSNDNDWSEINTMFLEPGLIDRRQIILMPEGQTREELQYKYEAVVEIATREGVRFSDRLHVTIWNKKTGV